jgi:surface protein
MSGMFWGCKNFNQPLNDWNVSNVENTSNMFYKCENFNQPLDNWDVRNVEDMHEMFSECRNFNQLLDKWDIRNVENLKGIFEYTQVKIDSIKSWLPIKISLGQLKEIFGEDLPLEWQVLKGIRKLTDLTEEEYESLHPNCKNYLKSLIIDF